MGRLPKHDPSRLVNCYMPHRFSLLLLSPACFPLLKYSPIFAVNLPERFSPDLILRSQTRPRPDLSGILHLPSQKHYSNTSPKLVLHFQTRPSAAADLLNSTSSNSKNESKGDVPHQQHFCQGVVRQNILLARDVFKIIKGRGEVGLKINKSAAAEGRV